MIQLIEYKGDIKKKNRQNVKLKGLLKVLLRQFKGFITEILKQITPS